MLRSTKLAYLAEPRGEPLLAHCTSRYSPLIQEVLVWFLAWEDLFHKVFLGSNAAVEWTPQSSQRLGIWSCKGEIVPVRLVLIATAIGPGWYKAVPLTRVHLRREWDWGQTHADPWRDVLNLDRFDSCHPNVNSLRKHREVNPTQRRESCAEKHTTRLSRWADGAPLIGSL